MTRSILIYGIIAGLVVIVSIIVGLELGHASAWLGYLVMFIAFSTIFVAVKHYRDETLGGVIKFGTALLMGLAISAVAGIVYVLIWEIYLAVTGYDFIGDYTESMLEAKKQAGATAAELARAAAEAEQLAVQYRNPVTRLPLTFLEIFPVGVLVSIISAAVLRDGGRNG